MDSAGFFLCDHCHQVVSPAQSVLEAALSLPAGRLVDLECPRCRKRAVNWREPAAPQVRSVPAQYRPVSPERGKELWEELRMKLNLL